MEDDGTPEAGEAPQQAEWDERYASREQIWSGQPNAPLVDEVASLAPGSVLDVGCGEGADAVWLAQHGWAVTALDVSRVALERAAEHAAEAGVDVRWLHSGLVEASVPDGSFTLVSAQYPALQRTPDRAAERKLLSAVAPGGTLLVVHHKLVDAGHAESAHTGEGHADFSQYVLPADIEALLDDEWVIEVSETRERRISGGAGAHHTHDVVLRARRLNR